MDDLGAFFEMSMVAGTEDSVLEIVVAQIKKVIQKIQIVYTTLYKTVLISLQRWIVPVALAPPGV